MRNTSYIGSMFVRLSSAAIAALISFPACAQDWPAKPIVVVYPFNPGGGGDQMVRLVMNRLSRDLGQQVVVESRGGAGGTIGAAYVAKARPDGYLLLGSGVGSNVVAPVLMGAPFDSMKDFTHIALLGGLPQILVVNPAFEAKSMQQYVDVSRGKAGEIAFGSPGPGTHGHLIGELFKSITGAKLLHIPYSGAGPALADLLAGHIPSAFFTLATAAQHLRAGKLRGLAVSGSQRAPDFPDVPTFAELGQKELTATAWFGLSGPAGLSRPIVTRLNGLVRNALAQPDIRSKLVADGIEPGDLDAEGFTQFFRAEIARWTPVARASKEASTAGSKPSAR